MHVHSLSEITCRLACNPQVAKDLPISKTDFQSLKYKWLTFGKMAALVNAL